MKLLKIIPFIVLNEFKDNCMDHGVANGYVAIPPDNKYYGFFNDDLDEINVHGNITFSEPVICGEYTAGSRRKIKSEYVGKINPLLEKAVYLTLDRIIPDDWWILGFDTFHYPDDNKVDQNLDFCIKETLKLAEQLK